MANRQLVFPAGKVAERNAYADWADAQYALISGVPNDIFTYRRLDAFDQPYCAYLGPPFAWVYDEGVGPVVVEEPSGGEAMRADGVLADEVVLPPE